MLDHSEELKSCTSISDLRKFVNTYGTGKSEYLFYLKKSLTKETNFEQALIKVWNYALQQDMKGFLGKESTHWKRSGGSITGLECHSVGHR